MRASPESQVVESGKKFLDTRYKIQEVQIPAVVVVPVHVDETKLAVVVVPVQVDETKPAVVVVPVQVDETKIYYPTSTSTSTSCSCSTSTSRRD